LAEIVPVVSEALEAQVRDLLPSQRGFGEDLQASNVITPIIDLTAAAQGTTTPEMLQTAIAFGSQTAFSITNSGGTVIVNTAGFYRIFGCSSAINVGLTTFFLTDGLSNKIIWQANANAQQVVEFDFVVFLRSGDSLTGAASSVNSQLTGSYRQIADVNGNLVNPSGFTPQ